MSSVSPVADAARHQALGLQANDRVQMADLRVVADVAHVFHLRKGFILIDDVAEPARVALDGAYHDVEVLAVAREGGILVATRLGDLYGEHHFRLRRPMVLRYVVVPGGVLPYDVTNVREITKSRGRHLQGIGVTDALVDDVLQVLDVSPCPCGS